MSNNGIAYLTETMDKVIDYCIDEFDMNCSEVVGTLRLLLLEVEMGCLMDWDGVPSKNKKDS